LRAAQTPMGSRWRRLGLGAIVAALTPAAASHGQAPINSNVALQPAKGGLILRQQIRYSEAALDRPGPDPDIELATTSTTLVYGATEAITLLVDMPVVVSRRFEDDAAGVIDTEAGVADWTALAKIRLHRRDTAPLATTRIDAIAGLELPTGDERFSSDSTDPIVGGVLTTTEGRNAFSADLLWKFDTGGGGTDLLRYDAAVVRRLSPAQYTRAGQAAINGLLELNGVYETDGDNEVFLSPGVQYVTRRWILEASVQLPVAQDVSDRPEADFILAFGVRMQF